MGPRGGATGPKCPAFQHESLPTQGSLMTSGRWREGPESTGPLCNEQGAGAGPGRRLARPPWDQSLLSLSLSGRRAAWYHVVRWAVALGTWYVEATLGSPVPERPCSWDSCVPHSQASQTGASGHFRAWGLGAWAPATAFLILFLPLSHTPRPPTAAGDQSQIKTLFAPQ